MRSFRLFCAALFLSHSGLCQQLQSDDFNNQFAFEVHSVDDFFDRFNFKRSTAFQNYLTKKFPEVRFSRESFVISLFNRANAGIAPDKARDFVRFVTDSLKPQFVNYTDKDWFADLYCKVSYKGKPQYLNLILKVVKAANGGYSWDIVSAKAPFLTFRPTKLDSLISKHEKGDVNSGDADSKLYFLTPVSHGIDFLNIDNVFDNNLKINNYIYPGPLSFELRKLIYLTKKAELKFIQLEKINYHLLQIDGWILILDYFSRKDSNRGWLIDQLMKVNEEQKKAYKSKNLNIPLK